MIGSQGQCPHCQQVFKEIFRLYPPEIIRQIREALRETRGEFCKRFFAEEETVKGWEAAKGEKKHRELTGPGVRLMIMVEAEALTKTNTLVAILRRSLKRNNKEIESRYKGWANNEIHQQHQQNKRVQSVKNNRRSCPANDVGDHVQNENQFIDRQLCRVQTINRKGEKTR